MSDANSKISFNFGNLFSTPTTSSDNVIVVQLTALVILDGSNINTRVLLSNNSFCYSDQLSPQSQCLYAGVTLQVVEPNLALTKNSVTSAYVEAGNVVQYTLTLKHSGSTTSAAYDIIITDPLVTHLALVVGSVVTSSGSVTVGNTNGETTVSVTVPSFLTTGADVIVKYNATILTTAVATTTITNTATTQYYSARANSYNSNNIRQYSTLPATKTITIGSPTCAIVLSATSLPETPTTNVTIGETVTLVGTVLIPQGKTLNSVFNVTLPSSSTSKLGVVSGTAALSNRMTSTITPYATYSDSNGDGINDVATFYLGNITNNPDGISQGAGDTVTITLVTLVVLSGNSAGSKLTSSAKFTYSNGVTSYNVNPPASVTVQVILPALSFVSTASKSISDYVEGGTVISYTHTITSSAQSTGPAYGIVLADVLPRDFAVSGTITTTTGSVNATSPSVIVTPATYAIGGSPVYVYSVV